MEPQTTRWMIGAMALVLMGSAPAQAAPGPLPWAAGEAVMDGWEVRDLQRHPEYLRLSLHRGEATAKVEIVSGAAGEPWSTDHYRVQPQPGTPPNPEALRALLASLRAWERRPDHVPFVGHTPAPTPSEDPTAAAASAPTTPVPTLRAQEAGSWPPEGRWLWLGGEALLLALLAACLARGRRRELGLMAASVLGGVIVWWGLDPSAIPTRWLNVLQEGSVASVVASIHGQGHHGPALEALRWLTSGGDVVPLRELVAMNLGLTAMNTVAIGALTWAMTRRVALGVLTAAAWALCPLQVNAALSDLPAALLTAHVLAAATAVACLERSPRLALGALGLAAALAGGVRLEWGVLGLGAWASAALSVALPERWRGRLDRGWTSALVWGLAVAVVLAAGVFASALAGGAPEAWAVWRRAEGGVVGLGMFTWPGTLLFSWPVGLALLATIGMVAALKRPVRWTIAPALWVVLYGVYWTSAHGGDAPYEVLRYAALGSGLAGVLVALGWRAVLRWGEGRRGGQVAWMVLGGLCLVSVPDGAWRPLLEAHHAESEGPLYDMPLTRHLQVEARSLITTLEAHPECVVATVSAVEPSASREVTHYEYVFFGGSLATPMLSDRVPAALETLLRGVRAPGECVIFHRGVDCQVAGGPDCIEETRGARLLGGVERAPRPYYDHVLRAEPVRLERWERPNEEGGEATASPR